MWHDETSNEPELVPIASVSYMINFPPEISSHRHNTDEALRECHASAISSPSNSSRPSQTIHSISSLLINPSAPSSYSSLCFMSPTSPSTSSEILSLLFAFSLTELRALVTRPVRTFWPLAEFMRVGGESEPSWSEAKVSPLRCPGQSWYLERKYV